MRLTSFPIRTLGSLVPLFLALGLCARADTVVMTPTPTSLSFSYLAGATLPAAQNLAVKAGSGGQAYNVSVQDPDPTKSSPLWVTATPETGKLPAALSVRVNPTGMPSGTYKASLVINADPLSKITVPVTLTVTQPPATLNINPLAISVPPAESPIPVTLSTSGGPVSFTASVAGAPWLTLSLAGVTGLPAASVNGVALLGAPATLKLNIDASSLSPQTYTGKVTIAATGVVTSSKSQTITVTLTVNSMRPTISTLWPSSMQVGAAATTITIRGSNFYSGTTVKITPRGLSETKATCTLVSPTTLLAVIPKELLATAGSLDIVASNPSGDSTAVAFDVLSAPKVEATVNLASYSTTSVSPGELVTIFGSGIGPATPLSMTVSNNFVDLVVGGVSVKIGSSPAPILYASQNQISVQVPYEASIGKDIPITVDNNGVTSTGTVNIDPTAPAIFTLDGTGVGQAAALNLNATTGLYALNAGNNQAKIGDTVVLYITGEGDYATSFSQRTGMIVSKSSVPQMSVIPTVTIGGVGATVQYAGSFEGSILGILQLNVVVPTGSTTGNAVPVTVSVGGVTSQSGVTLAVR